MKVLFISNLFPNCHEPARGVFNQHQVRHLAKLSGVQVIAPIAWFPIRGRFAPPARVPKQETIDGLTVYHPRQFYLPKIGRTLNPWLYAKSIQPLVERVRTRFPFDVLMVNWAYPDGCAVGKIARHLNLPFVLSVSGSDANLYLTMKVRRRQILRMIDQAAAVTIRSQALRELLESHGVPSAKLHVLYNGVDRSIFQPMTSVPRTQIPVLLYIGRLSAEKGVRDLIGALSILRHQFKVPAKLIVVGDGSQREELWQLAIEETVQEAITWVGWKKPTEIVSYLNSADLLCLPSHMEGVPNVALEAFACGLPVVATRVGGIPEIMNDTTGVLTEPKNPEAFATALHSALEHSWDRDAIHRHATRFDWTENARQLQEILERAADGKRLQTADRRLQTQAS